MNRIRSDRQEDVYCIRSCGGVNETAGWRRCIMPNMKEIREMAQALGIRSTRMEKAELIRAIQRAEGNFDCFGTATEEECDQEECLWRDDCFRDSVAEELR